MACYTEIFSISNTKTLHSQSDLNYGYIHKLYHDKQEITDYLFYQKNLPLLKDIDNPALIHEQKKHIDAAAYEDIKTKK